MPDGAAESNRGEDGQLDGSGTVSSPGAGLWPGVMNAWAAYYAKKGRAVCGVPHRRTQFRPPRGGSGHRQPMGHYDDDLSRELTERTAHANLEMRRMGFKPYVAPAPVVRGAEPAVSAGDSGPARRPIWGACSWADGTAPPTAASSLSGYPARGTARAPAGDGGEAGAIE